MIASKERKRRAPEPVGRGSPLRPSAAIRAWYAAELRKVVKPMLTDYKESIRRELESPGTKEFFAMDASVATGFQRILQSLNHRWANIFKGFAAQLSSDFVDKSDAHSKSSSQFSLSTAGIKQPVMAYTDNIANTLGASRDFNNTLITGIQEEVHEKIYNSVMLSLTSPDPTKQGSSGIANALREIGGFSEDRVDLITRDQTSKLYSALADERMQQNGVEEFEWLHSSAGKVPRPDHVAKDGMVFKLNDPRLWEGKKGDQGPPGWAINCRCTRVPVIR